MSIPPPLLLPEDVLMEILTRLPAKSLLRFRSVCKTWCALIQNPRFIALHHNRAENSLLVLRSIIPNANQQQQQHDSEIVMSFLSDEILNVPLSSDMMGVTLDGEVQLFGPCNGIVCLADRKNTVLCNPSTREFKVVPLPPFSYPRGLPPLTWAVGFGFDRLASDYKVVRISQLYLDEEEGYCFTLDSLRVDVYNLSTDSWRHFDVSVRLHVEHFPRFELFFNGDFHFLGYNDPDSVSILSFDISEEVFRQIPFPGVCSYPDGRFRSLSVLNDSLALILYVPLQVEKYFDIWVMSEYGVKESWIQLFRVGPLVGITWPLTFWNDAEFLLESSSGQLVSCDLTTREIKEFQVHDIEGSLQVHLYKESLISINTATTLVDKMTFNDVSLKSIKY